jgi:hypothetical protein
MTPERGGTRIALEPWAAGYRGTLDRFHAGPRDKRPSPPDRNDRACGKPVDDRGPGLVRQGAIS